MPPATRKLSAVMLFGILVGAVAPPASAQFRPSVRYNYRFGLSPAMSFNPWLPTLPLVPGRYSFSGYTLTGVGLNGPYSVSYGYYRNTALTVGPVVSPYYGGYGGGVGTLSGWAANSTKVAGQQRAAIASAQRTGKRDVGTPESVPDFDKWLQAQAAGRDAGPPAGAAGPPAVDPALIDPPEEAVLSGDVLNRLVGLITAQQGNGRRADAGLCGPDLMAAVVFEGGPAADAANQFRSASLTYPEPLRGMPFDELRERLSKAYAEVATPVHAGKRVAAADVDRLLAELARARELATPLLTTMSVDDAKEVSRFYTQLVSATKYLKDPNSAGVAGTKWTNIGVAVDDLVKHVNRFRVRFGPAAAGDEAVYFTLHRGLLAYYAALLQAK